MSQNLTLKPEGFENTSKEEAVPDQEKKIGKRNIALIYKVRSYQDRARFIYDGFKASKFDEVRNKVLYACDQLDELEKFVNDPNVVIKDFSVFEEKLADYFTALEELKTLKKTKESKLQEQIIKKSALRDFHQYLKSISGDDGEIDPEKLNKIIKLVKVDNNEEAA